MSINEIIKKYLPITNQKLPKSTAKLNHCQGKDYDYCSECNENKNKFCNEKLILWKINRINDIKWQIHFQCPKKHWIIRSVLIENKNVYIEQTRN